ncbi:MAG: sodium:proton antiporter [Glaciihabitans sp.]|nr:sodium:proton antiporter [Glaciihabitans sp.]
MTTAPSRDSDAGGTEHPNADAIPGDGRDESQAERLDRNWDGILQELRVTQTGTQLLTGFLLTLAFQQRFGDLDGYQIVVYLALVALAGFATALGIAPVVLHRVLFRKRAMARVVALADHLLRIALFCVALILTGTTLLIFDVVAGRAAGVVAGVIALLITILLWVVLPFGARAARRTRGDDSPSGR